MKPYKLYPGGRKFWAPSDEVAAVAVAVVGDYGFKDRNDLERRPANWTEDEFKLYLNEDLAVFRKVNRDAINDTVTSVRSAR